MSGGWGGLRARGWGGLRAGGWGGLRAGGWDGVGRTAAGGWGGLRLDGMEHHDFRDPAMDFCIEIVPSFLRSSKLKTTITSLRNGIHLRTCSNVSIIAGVVSSAF